ncbi:hypothetical protein NDU88_011267 [Pleurodeles waltl]|uniref:Uncharacterized protein n=1 Tax=Pleurodeles waltl TaxID=8319 RepID=A0AAV7QYB8_PLEWA|nr:hypothetical protein NDU88_011267 [Pleurodeles waltl]
MCLTDVPFSESRPRRKLDEQPGGRLRHWGRAALELRRARRGSARIPLRGNLGNASTSKAPGKVSREPGSAVTRAFSENLKKASEAAAGAGATSKTREEEKSPAPPQSSISLWQHACLPRLDCTYLSSYQPIFTSGAGVGPEGFRFLEDFVLFLFLVIALACLVRSEIFLIGFSRIRTLAHKGPENAQWGAITFEGSA